MNSFFPLVCILVLFCMIVTPAFASTEPVEEIITSEGANAKITVTPDRGLFDRSLNEYGWTNEATWKFHIKVENNRNVSDILTINVPDNRYLKTDSIPSECIYNSDSSSYICFARDGVDANSSRSVTIQYIPTGFAEGEQFRSGIQFVLFRDGSPQSLITNPITIVDLTNDSGGSGGGCLIATAAYGTELAPQIQLLREVRDNTVLSTVSGAAFMTGFNTLYYSFAPTVADWERENPMFKESVRAFITPMISTLSIMTLADDGSEAEVLGLGISVIALNLAMYIAAPALIGFKVHKSLKSRK